MRETFYGRVLFGMSAALFGAICLMWHDFDTWQSVYRLLGTPVGHIVGNLAMIALMVGGVLVDIPSRARTGAGMVALVIALFALVCVAGIFSHPKMFAVYDSVFEQVSILGGALAILATEIRTARRATTLMFCARLGYGLSLVSFMLAQVVYYGDTAPLVPKWLPPGQAFWAWATTVAFGLAAVAVLLNIRARLALGLTGIMLAVFGLVVWVPALVAHPQSHNDWSEFALNSMIMAAAWVIASAMASVSGLERFPKRL